jgi:hypothetical protein
MTPQERRRVIELVKQCHETGSSIEETVEIINKAMPHLTNTEVAQVLLVNAEERKLEAAEYRAEAEASLQIAKILGEVQQAFRLEQATLAVAIPILSERREQGDTHAAELLKQLENATRNLDIGTH